MFGQLIVIETEGARSILYGVYKAVAVAAKATVSSFLRSNWSDDGNSASNAAQGGSRLASVRSKL